MSPTRFYRLIGAVCCVLLAGCTPCNLVERTIKWEPSAFWWKSDSERSRATYRMWANQAWSQEGASCAAAVGSGRDFEAGFKDGFVEYVYAGGTGEPPPLPPRAFWNMDLRLPAGRERANQWFAGYREGARVARESGYRALAQVQSSLTGPPLPGMFTSGPAESFDQMQMEGAIGPPPEELPGPAPTSTEMTPGSARSAPVEINPSRTARSDLASGGPSRPEISHTRSGQEFDRSGQPSPAPDDIRLPSVEKGPALATHESTRSTDARAAQNRPLRLTSDPRFEW